MKRTPHTYAVGDRVAYSAGWLRSTGQVTGPVPFLRGTVSAVQFWSDPQSPQLVTVQWDGAHDARIISANLTLVSRLAIDAALA